MVSINNVAVNSAVLSSLRQTNAELSQTQNRIATGLKISSARDNATVWATAQSIRGDIDAFDKTSGNVAVAKGAADAAYTALTTIQDLLGKMKAAVAGLQDGSGSAKAGNVSIQNDLELYRAQISAAAQSASFQGTNLLTTADATEVKTVIGQDQGANIEMKFSTEMIVNTAGTSTGDLTTGAATANTNILGYDFTATSVTADITAFSTALDAAIASVNTYTARVGNYANGLGTQQDFFQKINDIRKTALSSLVDADMEQESARVSALQVKQQLAFQALAIGNNSSQNILRLFQ